MLETVVAEFVVEAGLVVVTSRTSGIETKDERSDEVSAPAISNPKN